MNLPSYYQRLIKKYPQVSMDEWILLDNLASVRYLKKGESFLKAGKVACYASFVLSGQFKHSLVTEDGDEKILKFNFADDFLANCESYNMNQPSAISIVALEDSVILRFNIKKVQPLYDLHLNILHINLRIYEELLQQQNEHELILSLKSPMARYRFLLKNRPMIIQKISLTNIARYLYVSREALSRARLSLDK